MIMILQIKIIIDHDFIMKICVPKCTAADSRKPNVLPQSDGLRLTEKYKHQNVLDRDGQILLISSSSNRNHTMLFPGLS